MVNKNFYYYFTLVIIFFIIVPSLVLAKEKKHNSIKLIVKEHQDADSSIKEVIKKLNELSKNMENVAKIYDTINQQAYWESEAKKSFFKYLQSDGYYDATIETELIAEENKIVFYVNGWQRYKIKKLLFKHAENSNHNIKMPDLSNLKIKEGDFAIASNIINVQNVIAKELEKNNCLLSLEVTHEAVIDHLDDSILVDFIINAGPHAKVKSVGFTGLTSVNPNYAKKLIPFKRGQCFRRSLITKAQNSLQKSSLFAITTPEIPDYTDANDEVPVIFDVKERKHRSFKAGFSYGSDLGFGITTGWNHRNFLGSGETVKTELFANQKEQIVDLAFTKPFYKQDNQTLKIGVSVENLVSKAFNNKEGSAFVGIERKLNDIWKAGVSGKYSYSVVKDAKSKSTKNYSFLSAPLFIIRDTRDNFLNPSKGHELQLKTEPFYPIKKEGKSFLKNEFIVAKYLPCELKFDPVIAIRAAIGSISGTKSATIPANERFYVGGAASVRGYAYQFAGEIDEKNLPIGGRSMIETAIELRTRVKNDIGLVVFFDSGNVYSSITPAFNKKMFHGYGVGVRYFTGFGPLRLDVGFPLKGRKKIDKAFYVYFGIGQNF
ncbi:MAG: autotransporter assembly complex family protein [Rickettsiaceae bacterium]